MLLVLVPVAYILATIGMSVNTEALGHVVNEFSLVEVSTGVIEFTSTIIKIIHPQPFIDSTIRPSHYTESLLDVGILNHLSRVDSTIFVLTNFHIMNIDKIVTVYKVGLIIDSLSCGMTSIGRLDLNDLFLVGGSVGQKDVLILLTIFVKVHWRLIKLWS
jgi:hypothetical protein